MSGANREDGRIDTRKVGLVIRILRHRHIANADGIGLFRWADADWATNYKSGSAEIEDAFRCVADLLDRAGYPLTLEIGALEVCHYVGTDEVVRRIEDVVRKQGGRGK